jgi:hypothetical protein
MSPKSIRRSSLLIAAALFAVSCGSDTPADPTATASPTPAPTPTPTPVPSPTPVNARIACGVGRGTGDGLEHSCPRSGESFLIEVDNAINRVVARSPSIFDFDDQRGAGGFYVKDVNRYYNEVVQELGNDHLCAIVDGGGEIAVKSQNSFNDQYHIMLSSGHVRRGEASYRASCSPAWF